MTPAAELPTPPAPVSFAQALRFWLKLGFISFGGPAGQIAIMHSELVERRRWISEQRFLHALNYCMLLPGPEAQQLATYIGWLMHRTRGGVAAGVLFVLPSLFILIALSGLYLVFGQVPLVAALFYGVKPAVAAIVVQAAQRIGSRTLHNRALWTLAIASFLAVAVLHLAFPWVLLAAALAGALGGRWRPDLFGPRRRAAAQVASHPPALIDDATPPPPHARFTAARLLRVLGAGALLWAGPLLLLVALQGWRGTLAQMAWFFTQAAWLTFGGAYAVLPFVVQGAVGHFAWLGSSQMIDGLALGETTPGPLIIVVAFVGFVGGWQSPSLIAAMGADHRFAAAALAATTVTWFTFLPSFILILAGGPLVEATRDDLQLSAPLTAISAAIVGVVLNLALYFLGNVLWPHGRAAGPDAAAALLALAAGLALMVLRRGVIEVLLASAVLGGLWTLLR